MNARRYQVRGVLGEGAFGTVYLANAVGSGLQKDVAIKVLRADRTGNPAIVRRLRDEARMLALIRHRAIVRVDDLVELDGAWSIVMEYVEGCDVATLLGQGPIPPRVALAIAEEVANALHVAWTQPGPDGSPLRLIHRDIKPSNVRVTAQGEVKLLDFGVARAEFAEREAGTTQTAFGTLIYMAPERFEGEDSHAGDVYALGVSLFEMLAGVPPGKIASDRDRQPPGRRLAQQWAGIGTVSKELHALLARMLADEPDQRPSARECARTLGDLRGLVGGERIEDWAARAVPAVLAEGAARLGRDSTAGTLLVERTASPSQPVARPVTRALPWLAGGLVSVMALGAALVVGGGAAWWAFRGERGAETPAAPAPLVTKGEGVKTTTGAGAAPVGSEAAPARAETAPVGSEPAPARAETAPTKAERASQSAAPAERRPATTTPLAEPRTQKAPASRPAEPAASQVAQPAPESPPAPASNGQVQMVGDKVTATFVGAAGRFENPDGLPAGVYSAVVKFGAGGTVTIQNVTVQAGRTTVFTCDAAWSNCSSRVR